MAELGLIVNILAKVDKALSEIDKIKDKMKKMGSEGVKQTDRATLSAKRMGASLALVGMIAGKAFKAIADASPSMQVAIIMANVEFENMWRSIGENLAPVLVDILMPAIEDLTEYIEDLAPEIQTWIGLTAVITLAIAALTIAVASLTFVSLPLVAAIVLMGAGIAFVILASGGYLDGMAEKSEKWADAIRVATVVMKIFKISLLVIWTVIKAVFLSVWGAIVGLFEGGILIADGIMDVIGSLVTFAEGVWGIIGGLFDVFTGKGPDKLIEGLKTVGIGILNFFIGIANIIIGLVQTVVLAILGIVRGVIIAVGADTTGIDTAMDTVKEWQMSTIKYHEGGTVGGPRDVMAWLKPKETIRTETQESALQRGLMNGGGRVRPMNITLNINYPSFNERGDMDRLASVIERRLTTAQYQRSGN